MSIVYGDGCAKGPDADVAQIANYLAALAMKEEVRESALQLLSEFLQRRVAAPLPTSDAKQIVDCLNDETSEWARTGFEPHEIAVLKEAKMSPRMAQEWKNIGVPLECFLFFQSKNLIPHRYLELCELYGYGTMTHAEQEDFDAALIEALVDIGVLQVLIWSQEKIPLREQAEWKRLGLSPSDAKQKSQAGETASSLAWIVAPEWTLMADTI